MKTRTLVVVLVSAILPCGLVAQAVDFVGVVKIREYNQTGAATTVEPSNPWSFEGFIDGTGLTGSFPLGSNTLTLPNGSAGDFIYDSEDSNWVYSGNSSFSSQAALNTAFANGTYNLTVGGISFSLGLTDDLYPNMPLATVSAGTWTGGLLQLTAAQASAGFSITSNTFISWQSGGMFQVGIWGDGPSYSQDENTDAANSLTMNVLGGALTVGNTYYFTVEFIRLTDIFTSTAMRTALGTNALGVAGYVTNTTFSVQVIPEPSTYAVIFGALALAGVMIHRRRRTT